jgi:hypothetical protein
MAVPILDKTGRFRGWVCCLFSIILFLPLLLGAVSFEPQPIESLAKQADVVLQGTVLSKTCQRDAAGRIYTRIELRVSDVWKGAVPGTPFVIVHGGGIVGEHESVTTGQVQFDLGEEVVVFLAYNQRGEGVTVGLMQGKFRVWQDTVTRAKFAVSPFHGVSEKAASQIGLRSLASPPGSSTPLKVSDLKARVQEAVR